ncbi:Iron-sulfur cluster regulator IscR [Georgfuchsia toluolica]|uniref:Iron-sulfur cluster regulator IscR n=1 Tax=Georgfuchsia toluolica TaxID=424218 RepID=A0A916J4T1_9PROT|nr:SUF system Fe-S cluster assembly regulator [Georgfuchsia toluolica]CAG4882467.1 Iron-sulfur cluster regulator IscR [Georgfuchsia toluolica]
MLRLSKLTDYSTVILSYMAKKPEDIYSVARMAAALGIAAPSASKILKILARRGLVQSRRGTNGGYLLARPPEQISIAEVIDAMEGPLGVTECVVGKDLCAREAGCSIRNNWRQLNNVIRQTLDGVTLADMNRSPGGRR